MAAHLLGADQIDRDLRKLIMEKTDGIPLYIEEFVQSLKDLGLVERKEGSFYLLPDRKPMAVPANIRAYDHGAGGFAALRCQRPASDLRCLREGVRPTVDPNGYRDT